MTESVIKGFEKACKIDESPSFIMRDTSFTDIDAEGVLVISGYDGGGIDLGSSTPDDGNNCIASTGYRVSNLEDGIEVQAEYNFWGDYPADEDWFNGDVNWDNALEECPLDLGGYFYLGQAAPAGGSESAALRLTGAYPNPFNPRCCIEFRLPDSSALASLQIFDLSGRLVKRLFAGECDGKEHTLIWKGDSDQSDPVGSGVYFARVQAGDETDTLKLVVLR